MRRRGVIFTVFGLILAIATGVFVFRQLQLASNSINVGQLPAAPTPTALPTHPVPVAARGLIAGTTISTTDIVQHHYPENLMPVGVLTDTSKLVGQVLVQGIEKGAFFQSSQVQGGGVRPLSQDIAQKNVVIAFSTDDLLNKSRVIHEGDHIDLLLTINIKEESTTETREGKATNMTLQNIRVLRIVGDKATDQNQSLVAQQILFEMAPQDAVLAKFVKDSGGTIDFTLRSPLDTKPFATDPINQDYVLDHYGLRAPKSSAKPK